MRGAVLAVLAACGTTSATKDRPVENIAFVTSTVHTGNLGGLEGADALCNGLATDAGIGGTYVAWLSTSTTSAYSRIQNGTGWVAIDGVPVAVQPSDLVTRSILSPLALDERGHEVGSTQQEVWTGTTSDGLADPNTCSDWTTDDPMKSGGIGDAPNGGGSFTLNGARPCAAPRRIYCFETDRTTQVTIPAPSGRLAFVTSVVWIPGAAGVAAADQLCQSEAASAGLSGTFLAVLPLPTAVSASRFDVTGPNWFNTAGMPLVESPERLFTATYLRAFWAYQADGTRVGATVWGGEPEDDHQENACGGWTTGAGTQGYAGSTETSSHTGLFVANGTACDAIFVHLLCLQP
jgi:hypothetical protein